MAGRVVAVWKWLPLGLVLGLVAGCSSDDTFQCVANDQCGADGFCEPNQYCSFPAGDCPSGRRFGDKAATGIAGQCVPEMQGSSSTSSTSQTSSTSAASTGGSTTAVESTSTGSGSSESSDTTSLTVGGVESSTSTGEPTGTTSGGSESTGEPGKCNGEPSNCEECLDCTTPSGSPCAAESATCFGLPNCLVVYDCLRVCMVDGACFDDCCDNVPPAEAEAAYALAQCQMGACEGTRQCGPLAEPICGA